jgi:hypothetical protein
MVALSQLVSHRFRGFSDHENTIQGLLKTLDFGVSQVEFDIRVTRCGTPLIYHDEAAKDQFGQTHRICDIMAADRDRMGGKFGYMPTADALFGNAARHPNKAKLLVDMKDAGFEDMLIALAHAHGIVDRIVWVSWLPETLYAVREQLPDAEITLSHWCQNPNALIRSVHTVHEAVDGEIARPYRRYAHGERSGWFVDGALSGEIRALVDNVCVPADMVNRALVEDYQRDNIGVSAFSYVTRDSLENAGKFLKLNDYFIDSKTVFDSYR